MTDTYFEILVWTDVKGVGFRELLYKVKLDSELLDSELGIRRVSVRYGKQGRSDLLPLGCMVVAVQDARAISDAVLKQAKKALELIYYVGDREWPEMPPGENPDKRKIDFV